MNRDVIRQWITILTIVALIVMNVLANALPLNGISTGAVSDSFKVYFVPAGYVFAIWGLIYIGLLAYGIYQALPAQKENPRLRRAAAPFVAGSLANIAWLFFWHYGQFALTVVAMLILLASLIMVYLILGVNQVQVSKGERWLVHVPISVYLGWISVATIANITNVLWYAGWSGFGLAPEVWAVIMLAVAVVLAFLMALRRGDVAYLLVLAWAFAGIGVKQADTPLVSTAAWIATGLVFVAVVLAVFRKRTTRAA
jgi:benzodiazapine receptor